ncbi:MFS transporter [Actinomadura macrotermitis]|uniref:Major facilitator superfamily (MFS) profile domain-containing protein n=1 Tax=Actinomadura macrotermitis TaxID=2585200 RepID=A0A7K0BYR6_9ACTN|nr:MFS transporter [Actinomadura macrotermitis]MQY05794.1 hypothetical protein [Actinomadura macrotermitis]
MTIQDIPTTRPLLTRPLVLVFAVLTGSLVSFFLLMPVVPLYVAAHGAGGGGAGLCTGAMMLTTVLAEPFVPRLMARLGSRTVVAAGLVLMGVPALALPLSGGLPLVLAVCLVRGVGFGVLMVAGVTLVAEIAPAGRRDEALGLYGVVVGLPGIVVLPLGVWLSERAGYTPVFIAGAAAALAALVCVAGLPALPPPPAHAAGVVAALRRGALARPALVFGAVTLVAGVLPTFLPLAVADRHLAAAALFVHSCVIPVARWLAGRYGSARLLLGPAVALAAAGTGALVWTSSPVTVLAGVALFGAGFGIAQNVSLSLMFDRADRADFGAVSALWNLAYDGGMGIGAVGFGFVVSGSSYATGFAVAAAVLVAALAPAVYDRIRG